MQTIQKTQYHCAELRRSVPVMGDSRDEARNDT